MNNVHVTFCRTMSVLLIVITSSFFVSAQSPVTSIVTSGSTASTVTYTNYKGAGLRNPGNVLISDWDSLASSFTVRFSAPSAYNILNLMQFSVGGVSNSILKLPVSAHVKVRRLGNTDVGDARFYHNFWAAYSSMPAAGSNSGSFDYTAPEVLLPEDAFLTNNLTSGYDNIFQNTILNPHFGNLERVDFLVPGGLKPWNDTDRFESGTIVIDRGVGDAFKIAAITALNASGDPIAFGPMLSVVPGNFGGNLLSSSINYGILINDINYYGHSRPSTRASQNLRGVFISLADLGIAVNQIFYGYSLFGNDVASAEPDWTTYPNNTAGNSQLDPVNIMGIFKSTNSVLAVPLSFSALKNNHTAKLNFTIYNKASSDHVIIERSADGINFTEIGRTEIPVSGKYSFLDEAPGEGTKFYRLQLNDKDGTKGYSEIKMLQFEKSQTLQVYPNPASDVLHIELPKTWLQKQVAVELWNVSGQLAERMIINKAGQSATMFIKNQKPGLYQLRLINTRDNFTILQSIIVSY